MDFSGMIESCLQDFWFGLAPLSCESAFGDILEDRLTLIGHHFDGQPNRLERVYRTIRLLAPNARILVIGYPRLFDASAETLFCFGARQSDQVWLSEVAQRLNNTIRHSALHAGVEVVDLHTASAGYELCNVHDAQPWVWGVHPFDVGDSFHPSPFGYDMMTYEVLVALSNPSPPAPTYLVPSGGAIEIETDIAESTATVTFNSSWPGSAVQMSLIAPSGEVIDESTVNQMVFHESAETWEVFQVEDPEPGTWIVRLFGEDVPDTGEETALVVHMEPGPDAPPVAMMDYSVVGRTVRVDATASTDPDGSIAQYIWDWGDGSVTFGAEATHLYGDDGPWAVVLIVRDDGGRVDFAYSDILSLEGYPFQGFFAPLDHEPVVNVVRAGRAVPVKFSLEGDRGLDLFQPSSPSTQSVSCESGAVLDDVEETLTAGESSLEYDSSTDTYTYVWKTRTAWDGTCRQLAVRFNDGQEHTVLFMFR